MKNRFSHLARKSVLNITPYVPGKPIQEVQRDMKIKDVIKLASNENPIGPSKKAIRAIEKAAKEVNLYPESSAYYLRKTLSKKLKVKPEQLIFGNGSNQLEVIIGQSFVNPGDYVMFSALSFVVYPIIVDIVGGTAIQVPHKEFRHDIDGFIERLGKKTKLVFLCNPNNPTGSIITRAEFEKFMKACPLDTIVALDEAYIEYAKCKDCPEGISYLDKYPNLIVLRTFSKIYGLAGTRIGYAVAHPDIISIMERVRQPFNTNSLAQEAANAALADTDHVNRTLEMNREGKKYLYAELKKMKIEYVKTYGNFIFVKFDENSKVVFEELLKKGVIIRPVFDNFARITIGKPAENRKFIRALKMLKKENAKKEKIN